MPGQPRGEAKPVTQGSGEQQRAPGQAQGAQEPPEWGPGASVQWRREKTHERARVRWKRWRRPRNMTKDRGGKERVDTSQKGISKPPAGHWQRKPPSAPLVQVPPLRHTPGTQRPERLSTSQFSPGGSKTGGLGHVPAGGHTRSSRPSTPCPRGAGLSLGLGQGSQRAGACGAAGGRRKM